MTLTGDQEFKEVTSIGVTRLDGGFTGATLQVGVGGNCQVKKGSGKLWGITVGETAAGAIKLIDGVSGTTTNLGELKASIVEATYQYRCNFAQGLRVILAAASKTTVIYK